MTGTVLVIVLITKFPHGAWIAIAGDGRAVRSSCGASTGTTTAGRAGARSSTRTRSRRCPSRVHAIVLVSKIHKPTLRALAYARATRPVGARGGHGRRRPGRDRRRCVAEWDRRGIPVPLKVARLAVPRDHPADRRLRQARSAAAARATSSTVYIPEYVVGHWWEQLLHNQSALRLKGRLLFTPGVMVRQRALAAALVRGRRAPRDGGARRRCGAASRATDGPRPRHRRRLRERPALAGRGRRRARARGRPGRPRRALRRPARGPGRLRPARAARRAGARPRSPTAATATGSCAPTPSRCSTPSPGPGAAAVPVRRPGRLRRLRLAARRPGRASAR